MAYARAAAIIATPIGQIRIEAEGEVLTDIWIRRLGELLAEDHPLLSEACAQLTAYFGGTLTTFDLPLAPVTGARGQALRDAISSIPYGETLSYGALAARSGSSARAIGQACARNRFPIVVPCHRVLAAGGALGPYSAGGGSTTKAWLLKHEHAETWLL